MTRVRCPHRPITAQLRGHPRVPAYRAVVTLATTGAMAWLLCGCNRQSCLPDNFPPWKDRSILSIAEEQAHAFPEPCFNPFSVEQRWPTLRAMFEPLMIWNPRADADDVHPRCDEPHATYVPWLASGCPEILADGTSMTIDLRDGVRWSDGVANLTPADVQFTFGLLQRHGNELDTAGVWDRLDSVEATAGKDSEHAVKFQFKEPCHLCLHDIVSQPIVPKHLWEHIEANGKDALTRCDTPTVATGPYVEVEPTE